MYCKHKGFNLAMALGMILLLSAAGVLTIKYISISAKHTADSYIKEQADIFAQSVLEATILKIQGHDRANPSAVAGTLDGDCIKQMLI